MLIKELLHLQQYLKQINLEFFLICPIFRGRQSVTRIIICINGFQMSKNNRRFPASETKDTVLHCLTQ